jgi:hypothetical protein
MIIMNEIIRKGRMIVPDAAQEHNYYYLGSLARNEGIMY